MIIPKKRNSRKRYSLSEEETKRFLHLIRDKPWDKDVKRILIILLFTGIRIGECLGLAWEDIDFEKKRYSFIIRCPAWIGSATLTRQRQKAVFV